MGPHERRKASEETMGQGGVGGVTSRGQEARAGEWRWGMKRRQLDKVSAEGMRIFDNVTFPGAGTDNGKKARYEERGHK